MEYKPIRTPLDRNWLRRVPVGAPVFLVKENGFAFVEWAFDPRTTGRCGRIGLRFPHQHDDTWFINPDGTGINGSQCLLPCEGFLMEEEVELPPKYLNDIMRRLERLEEIVLNTKPRIGIVVVDADDVAKDQSPISNTYKKMLS